MIIDKHIGFIGAGNMAEALIKGMLGKELLHPDAIYASDVVPERLNDIRNVTGINITARNMTVVESSHIIILAVKPQAVLGVLEEIGDEARDKVLVSIVAGLTIQTMRQQLGEHTAIVRVMPNTPALIGEAMTCLSFAENVGGADRKDIRTIFESFGCVIEVSETKLNAVTALSGSGPGYIFYITEALIQAGQKIGLDPGLASELALQTLLGSSKMLAEGRESPEELRKKVTSPGGTTEAGLSVLENHNVKAIFAEALSAAQHRAEALSVLQKAQ